MPHTIVHVIEDASYVCVAHVCKSHAQLNHLRAHGGSVIGVGRHHGIVVGAESSKNLAKELVTFAGPNDRDSYTSFHPVHSRLKDQKLRDPVVIWTVATVACDGVG